jgi:prepilin peptidase CpaA
VATALLIALAGAAALCDLRGRRIPPLLNAAIAASGVIVMASHGALLSSLTGLAVGLALLLPAFAARWIGGGDVKLVAALGAWLGPVGVLWAASLGLALGAVLAIGTAIAAGITRDVIANLRASVLTRSAPVVRRDLLVPLAVPLAIAAVAVHAGALP